MTVSVDLALALAAAGLGWQPTSGDVFTIPGGELAGDTFVVSELTIEPRAYPTGTVLAFNGTTEWALDSVRAEDALWLPREDQLRAALGEAFRMLERESDDGTRERWSVTWHDGVASRRADAATAADAYGAALLEVLGERVRGGD